MTPVLRVLQNGEIYSRRQLYATVIENLELPEEQLALVHSSGNPVVENRIGWAVSALTVAEAIIRPARGQYRITETGQEALKRYPQGMQRRDLFSFPAWAAHEEAKASRKAEPSQPTHAASQVENDSEETPEDRISSGIQELHDAVADELLSRLQQGTPQFFESAVVRLLISMGYGGAEQKGMRVGGTADGGIDGFVDQDPLGLERVYVQAKRYQTGNGVGRETIQAFIGALHGRGASKGVFITTSHLSRHAQEYAENIPTRIILIDGQRLTSLLIKYRVGVQVQSTYDVVAIDEDFFE